MHRAAFLFLLALPAAARAYSYDGFLGWSPDGSFYLYTSAGTDMIDHPVVCLSDQAAGSTSWPKNLARPEDDVCVSVCGDDDVGECGRLEDARRWVRLPAASSKGPHGETLKLKMAHGRANVTVLAGGKKVVDYELGLWPEGAKPQILSAHWRPDGGAVAVTVGSPDPDANDQTPGWPPPRFVGVIPFKAASAAGAANVRGMKLYRQKDYRRAADEFRKAIASDPRHLLAHYNLACVAALDGDKKTALAELRWLAGNPDPAAAGALAKAKTDPDLRSVVGDPEARKLLGGASCDELCEIRRDGCDRECSDRSDDGGLRACGRACGMAYDECIDGCPKKK